MNIPLGKCLCIHRWRCSSGKGRLESCVLLCSDLLEPFSWRNNKNNYSTGRFLTLFTDSRLALGNQTMPISILLPVSLNTSLRPGSSV